MPSRPIKWPVVYSEPDGDHTFEEYAILFEDFGTSRHRYWLFHTKQWDKLDAQYPDGERIARDSPATADGAHAGNVLKGQSDGGQP